MALALRNLWKANEVKGRRRYGLKGLDFTLGRGEAIGILGRNGAGQSMPLRLLGGVEFPTHGVIDRGLSVSWPLAAGFGVQASLVGAGNARFIVRIYGAPVERRLALVRDFAALGDCFRMPLRTCSAGMHGRFLFAMSLAPDFDCYPIDETTSAGIRAPTRNAAPRCRTASRARLTRWQAALPQQLAGFDRLNLEREFADRQLASALASLDVSQMDAQRQQLFVARIVQPQRPGYALYPERWFIMGSAATVLLVLYGLGWLLMAGVREHANN
jgi:capsular polysaccharide transport system ATP-binding protein